ncbi:MAG: putative sulfatase [Candidatus Hydrogenedentota bacterium]
MQSAVLGSAALAGAYRANAQDAPERPNIVFLFSDDHSVPDLGCYGNDTIRTPNLDALAAAGMRFDRAYVTSPQCSPSRASILTGRSPHAVGASRLHVNAYPDAASIPTLLKEAGYFTGAFRKVYQGVIQRQFDFYGGNKVPFAKFFEERPKDKPFFLWFGSTDPHRDYEPGAVDPPHDPESVKVPPHLPDTPEVRRDIALYYDEIGRFDRECGELLALLDEHGLADNTLVVMSGDNGRPFPRAKATVYEPGIHVPLLARWPGRIEAGRSTNTLVSLMDLAATWLDVAGATIPDAMESVSLVPLLRGDVDRVHEYVFCERNWHDNWDPIRSVVGERYKLIQNYRPEVGHLNSLDLLRSPSFESIRLLAESGELKEPHTWYLNDSKPRVEFYDLESDPGEWHNLAGDPGQADRIAAMQQALGKWMNATHDFLPPPASAAGGPYKDTLDGEARWWNEDPQ